MADFLTRRAQYLTMKSALYSERASWMPHWQDISRLLLPRSGRFITSDRNLGGKRHNDIYDSTATQALRVLAAGMMAGMTSPARPWFRLATSNPDLMEYDSVQLWLSAVTDKMRRVFARSNTYRSLHKMYEGLGAFGTAATIILPDFENVIHHTPLAIGEYALATGSKGEVDTMVREFDMTVQQMVDEFGIKNVSTHVRDLYENKKAYGSWQTIVHVIRPREEYDAQLPGARNMPFVSCYFENAGKEDKYLREGGFKRFPGLAPRWDVDGGDVYGSGPGMECLGDIAQLQHQQLRKAQVIDYQTKPPLQAPTSTAVDMLPGGITYYDAVSGNQKVENLFNVQMDHRAVLEDIQDVRERIRRGFYADLFLMLANDERRSPPTAREVAERHEEKLLMLGPTLERLHNEMLMPKIDLTFDRMLEVGMLPPPPKELHGADISIEFVSVLAQAQRAVGIQAVERLLGTVGVMSQYRPEVLDKIETDEIVDGLADMLGVDPRYITSDDKVALIRKERQEKVAQQQQQMAMNMAADTAQKTGAAAESMQGVPQDMMNQFTGYSLPQGAGA